MMNYRINTHVLIVVGAFILIALGLFAYTLVSAPSPEESQVLTTSENVNETPELLISAKHRFEDGIHTIAGTVTVPTTCHRVVYEPFLIEGGSIVEVRFSTLLEGSECPSSPTDVPFRVVFEAPENAEIRATWNGAPAILNLVPAEPGDALDGDMYFKG